MYIINNVYKCYECGFISKTYDIDFNINDDDYIDAKKKHPQWDLTNKLGVITCPHCKTKNHLLIEDNNLK